MDDGCLKYATLLLTCGVHGEKVVSGQLFFAVEFGDFVGDCIIIGVHQAGKGDRSWADTTKPNGKKKSTEGSVFGEGGENTYKLPAATLKSLS